MRIAIFSENFYPEISGISDSIINLATELAKRKHFIHFYVPKYSPKNYAQANQPEKEKDLGPNIAITRFFSFSYAAGTGQGRIVIPTGLRWLQVKKFNPDIIHTQLFFGVGFEALAVARFLRKPIIGTNHTAIKEFAKYSPIKTKWAETLILKYVNWYYNRCDVVTAPSRSVIDEMKFYGFEKEGHIISNPINTDTFTSLPDKNRLRKKFGLSDFTLVSAGRLAAEKNFDVTFKAIALVKKEIPSVNLALAGGGTDEMNLKKLAESLGIKDSVKFLGILDKNALAEVYNASKAFVITSKSETQSLVMMDAMASGLPIIGVKARALPEYISDKNGFCVEPDDYKAVAEKIILLLKNKPLAKKLGEGGKILAHKFSIPEIATEWEMIYRRTIESYNKKVDR